MKERVCERVRFREKERAFDKKGKGVKRTRERERGIECRCGCGLSLPRYVRNLLNSGELEKLTLLSITVRRGGTFSSYIFPGSDTSSYPCCEAHHYMHK